MPTEGGCATSRRGDDTIEPMEDLREMSCEIPGPLALPRSEEGLAAAGLVLWVLWLDSHASEDLEGCQPDLGFELIDVARDEERNAHRVKSPARDSLGHDRGLRV
jgi:hypothetical protein